MATHIGCLLDDPPRLARVWGDLMAFVAAHGIRPVVGATFSFGEMAEAHRLMESAERGEDRGADVILIITSAQRLASHGVNGVSGVFSCRCLCSHYPTTGPW